MPELPEVACVCLSLERLLVGRLIEAVRVKRRDIITGPADTAALLVGDTVSAVIRHGKQLAIVGSGGGCVCVHLGMSGQLCVMGNEQAGTSPKKRSAVTNGSLLLNDLPAHTHVLWQLTDGVALRFTDPRRFGGLWTFSDSEKLVTERWSKLGPDALRITPGQLSRGLSGTTRSLKAALLDQNLVAGLGNIYVDELLFNAKLHPLLPANALDPAQVPGLVRRMKTLLHGAIERGGSSLRDYVDGANQRGSQQDRHRVYGRSGLPCKRRGCGGVIMSEQVAGRTTAWCPSCQRRA
ncbi:MAG: bifunctional DNA-formamidopyrimidine glycosylase/DNA-(apurinic or apyrimidinic site) lyase [Phycisphaeraceae bacterium]